MKKPQGYAVTANAGVGQNILAVAASTTPVGVPEGQVGRVQLSAEGKPTVHPQNICAEGSTPAPQTTPAPSTVTATAPAATTATDAPATVVAADPNAAVRAQNEAFAANMSRVTSIQALASKFTGCADIIAKAVQDGISANEAELLCFRKHHSTPPANNGAGGVSVQASGDMETVLRCAVFLSGLERGKTSKTLEAKFKPEVISAAADLRLESVTDILRFSAGMNGVKADRVRPDNFERVIRAAYSTSTLSESFSGLVHYFIVETWGDRGQEKWRVVCPSIRNVRDFRSVEGLRLNGEAMMKDLAVGGKIENGTLGRDGWSIKATTKAIMFNLTREQIINDDPGLLQQLRRLIGFQYRQSFDASIDATIASVFTGLDAAKKKDLAFSADNLSKIVAYLYKMANVNTGKAMRLEANTLVVSPMLADAALALVGSNVVIAGSSTGTVAAKNVHMGRYNVFTCGDFSDTEWGVIPSPDLAPIMQIAALDGNYMPTIEADQGPFDQLGLAIRAYVDTGFAAADTFAILGKA